MPGLFIGPWSGFSLKDEGWPGRKSKFRHCGLEVADSGENRCSDGKHLVVCIGEDTVGEIPSLLLDFPRHE
jgi:hypothetical protein